MHHLCLWEPVTPCTEFLIKVWHFTPEICWEWVVIWTNTKHYMIYDLWPCEPTPTLLPSLEAICLLQKAWMSPRRLWSLHCHAWLTTSSMTSPASRVSIWSLSVTRQDCTDARTERYTNTNIVLSPYTLRFCITHWRVLLFIRINMAFHKLVITKIKVVRAWIYYTEFITLR